MRFGTVFQDSVTFINVSAMKLAEGTAKNLVLSDTAVSWAERMELEDSNTRDDKIHPCSEGTRRDCAFLQRAVILPKSLACAP